jgi:hypothetical protein
MAARIQHFRLRRNLTRRRQSIYVGQTARRRRVKAIRTCADRLTAQPVDGLTNYCDWGSRSQTPINPKSENAVSRYGVVKNLGHWSGRTRKRPSM